MRKKPREEPDSKWMTADSEIINPSGFRQTRVKTSKLKGYSVQADWTVIKSEYKSYFYIYTGKVVPCIQYRVTNQLKSTF